MDVQALSDLVSYGLTAAELIDHVIHGLALSELGEGYTLLMTARETAAEAPVALQQFLAMTPAQQTEIAQQIAQQVPGFPDMAVASDVQAVLNLVIALPQVIQIFHNGTAAKKS